MTSILVAVLGLLLLADVFVRYRTAHRSGFRGASDWKGLLSYPVIGIMGAICSLGIGWVGIALAVAAGVVSSETFKIESPPDLVGVSATSVVRHTMILQIGVLFLFEMLSGALCLREIIKLLDNCVSPLLFL